MWKTILHKNFLRPHTFLPTWATVAQVAAKISRLSNNLIERKINTNAFVTKQRIRRTNNLNKHNLKRNEATLEHAELTQLSNGKFKKPKKIAEKEVKIRWL